MKTRFTTLDICSVLPEINGKVAGMRLANVYDINNKTYLLKLAKPDSKAMLLMESGIRLHLSEFDWPKNMMPSGFSMKLRKHLRGRRLVSATQLGIDRIVDIQFGSDEAAYHVILELYDRGNIILTDHQYTVLMLLRFRRDKPKDEAADGDAAAAAENTDVCLSVGDQYPIRAAKQMEPFAALKMRLSDVLKACKPDDGLKKILIPQLPYGAPCIEHCLRLGSFPSNEKLGSIAAQDPTFENLVQCFDEGNRMLTEAISAGTKGYIIQKVERKKDGTDVKTNIEFHPFLFKQHEDSPHVEFPSFNSSVDEFFGNLESQKADVKILQQEKSAYKKLENIKKDHEQRLAVLEKEQDIDVEKARLIEANLYLVDQAIRVVRTAIANQIDWNEISSLLGDAKANGDPVAQAISKLKLQSNEMTMALQEQAYGSDDDEDFFSDDESDQKKEKKTHKPIKVDIDLGLSAHGNAKKYYDKKRQAASKQQKTIDASEKAFKSAEKKVTETLKEAATIHNIQKARKTFWFEKFLWFVSSENYLVIGGRDAQQNEILVKKYLIAGDVYVHADLHGATSCIVKNPKKSEIPPKTLNEAGTMAICHSAAWNAKVVTSAWWVHHDQVSKTAPSGEYLTTGSFLIRGKKNYLPPSYLVYGFAILFKVDETCVHKHKDERRVVAGQEDAESVSDVTETSSQLQDLEISSESDEENDEEVPAAKGDDETLEKDDETIESDAQNVAVEFPDTEVKIDYGSKILLDEDAVKEEEDADPLEDAYSPPSKPEQRSKPRMSAKQRRDLKKNRTGATEGNDSRTTSRTESPPVETKTEPSNKPNIAPPQSVPAKRGQRNKAKKLKGKYKDQDEEERQLKMELLQQAQSQKARDRKAKKNNAGSNQGKSQGSRQKMPKPHYSQTGQGREAHQSSENRKKRAPDAAQKADDDGSDEEREKILQNEHLADESVDILNSLTGCPLPDDVLLFALPVCAPYNTVQNYKFKVKLTPGNTKKGKGAKTALSMFQNLRDTTALEKDHLRSIKDNDLSRNIPGKIKVSAPNLQAYRKKK